MAVILAPDPNDREFVIVDTTPTGADPDAVLSFEVADTHDEAADTLDAAAVAEQPWPDLDPETEHQDDQGGELSFGIAPILVGDTSTRAGWLQSALKAIVAPGLPVDGELGPHTVQAVQQFQRRSQDLGGGALVADGAVDPDDEVRFSYWTPGFRDYKPYNVSRYKGARKGLLTDAAIRAIGYSISELRILRANALKESGGAFGAINTWDDQRAGVVALVVHVPGDRPSGPAACGPCAAPAGRGR